MIGTSLSLCIADILADRVSLDEVEFIVAGTKGATPEQVDGIIAAYRDLYWQRDPAEGERICRQLLAEGRVLQPRLEGQRPIKGRRQQHWYEDRDEVARLLREAQKVC